MKFESIKTEKFQICNNEMESINGGNVKSPIQPTRICYSEPLLCDTSEDAEKK